MNYRNFRRKNRYIDGFSMAEMIVVILIIAVLISIAIPSYLPIVNQVRCRIDLNNVSEDIIHEVNRTDRIVGEIINCKYFQNSQELKFYVRADGKPNNRYYYFPTSIQGREWQSEVNFGEEGDRGVSFMGGVVWTTSKDKGWQDYDEDNGFKSLIGKKPFSSTRWQFMRK